MAAALVHESRQPRIAVDGPSLTAATASVEAAAAAAAAATVTAVSNSNHQYMQQQYHQQKHQQHQTRPLEALASRFEALTVPSAAEARSRGVAESGAENGAKAPPSAERAQKARAEWSSASERTLRAAVSADPRAWSVGGSCGNLASECRSADSGSGSGSGSGSSSDTSPSAVSNGGEDSAACEEVSRSLRVGEFAEACDGIGRLFSVLGPAFAFAGKEFSEKVADLHVAGRQFDTLKEMMAEDRRRGVARVKGSHTRNLLRVVRGLDLNRRIFALLLQDCSQPLRVYAGRAYNEVFGAVHPWPVRSLVAAGLFTLPSTPAFLLLLGESDEAWQGNAEHFVAALSPIIQAVDHLFLSQGLGLDW